MNPSTTEPLSHHTASRPRRALRLALAICGALGIVTVAVAAQAQEFSYNPAGQLEDDTRQGRVDERNYVPGMRYPIEEAPSYANSQVYGYGGYLGPGGGQCDPNNYSYPWSDNYCEARGWDMPLCPAGTGHQGQDIRPATCTDKAHWAVAAENGTITGIGSYSVTLTSDDGTRHRYLHMDPGTLAVSRGQRVNRGDRLGLISDAFGGTPTSIHLHYDLNQSVEGVGNAYVPTYIALVRSYEALLGAEAQPCPAVGPDTSTIDNTTRCFDLFGPSRFWRYVEGQGVNGDLYWTNAFINDDASNWARWRLNFARAGRYRLFINTIPEYAQTQEGLYEVRHAGQQDTVRVNQAAGNGDWVLVGEFDFDAGEDQWVIVYDNTGEDGDLERHIMVDALRIEPVGGDQPDPADAGDEDADQPDPGPDADEGDDVPPDEPDAPGGDDSNDNDDGDDAQANNGDFIDNNAPAPSDNLSSDAQVRSARCSTTPSHLPSSSFWLLMLLMCVGRLGRYGRVRLR